MSNAGRFELTVNGPYPCWCRLSYEGEFICSFTHNELSDLRYTVEKAMQEAALKGDQIAEEVYPK